MAHGKGKNGKEPDGKGIRRKRRLDGGREMTSEQNQVVAAVGAVALVLGAGLGVLLFGASRKRADAASKGAGTALPGNLALGGDATGGLASDGPVEGANDDTTQAGDWFAMREGAGGADAVAVPEPSGAQAGAGMGDEIGEHVPTDLAPGLARPDRAVEAFRPDRDARVLPAERDAFAPATMPVPSRVEAMGNGDDD